MNKQLDGVFVTVVAVMVMHVSGILFMSYSIEVMVYQVLKELMCRAVLMVPASVESMYKVGKSSIAKRRAGQPFLLQVGFGS